MRSDFTKAETEVLKWLKKVQQEREKNMLKASPITTEQWKKVLKAVVYAFVSGFTGSFVLVTAQVLIALQGGLDGLKTLLTSLFVGAVVAGVNGALVAIKQVFTPAGQ